MGENGESNGKYRRLIVCSPGDSFDGGSLVSIGRQQVKHQEAGIKKTIGSGEKVTIIAGSDESSKDACQILRWGLRMQGEWIDTIFSEPGALDKSSANIAFAANRVLWFINGDSRKNFIFLPGKKIIDRLVIQILTTLQCQEKKFVQQRNLFDEVVGNEVQSAWSESRDKAIASSVKQGGVLTVIEIDSGNGNTFYIK